MTAPTELQPAPSLAGAAPAARSVEDAGVQRRERDALTAGLLAVVLAAVALATYRPWRAVPMDRMIGDFWPLVAHERSLSRAFTSLLEYYGQDGRFQPIYMFGVAAQTLAFGSDGRGWQLVAFGFVLVAAVLVALLAARLGASRTAAVLGGGLLLVSQAAAPSVLVPHWFAEPLSAIFLLLSAHAAIGFRDAASWPRRALLVTLLAMCAVLTKETTIAGFAFVAFLATFRERNRWSVPKVEGRLVGLAIVMTVGGMLVALPILFTRASASGMSYGATYTIASRGIRDVVLLGKMFTIAPKVPARVGNEALFGRGTLGPIDPASLLHPPNLLVALVVLVGLALALRGARGRPARWVVAASASLLLPGMAVYVFWPALQTWYAFPYLAGLALPFATGADAIGDRRGGRFAVLAAYAAIVAVAMRDIASAARQATALRAVEWDVLTALPAHAGRESVLIASPRPDGGIARSWRRTGNAELAERFPLVHAVSCAEAGRVLAERRNVLVVRYLDSCNATARVPARRAARFTRPSAGSDPIVGIELLVPLDR